MPKRRRKSSNRRRSPKRSRTLTSNDNEAGIRATPSAPLPPSASQGVTRLQAQKIKALPPSPNLQTRSKRKGNGASLPLQISYQERKRIADLIEDFEDHDFQPCSIFGRHREEIFKGFKFCRNCFDADEMETTRPQHKLNRKAENGRYTCRAKHKGVGFPTTKRPPPPKVYRKKQTVKQSKPNNLLSSPSDISPTPLPTLALYCFPTQETVDATDESKHHDSPQDYDAVFDDSSDNESFQTSQQDLSTTDRATIVSSSSSREPSDYPSSNTGDDRTIVVDNSQSHPPRSPPSQRRSNPVPSPVNTTTVSNTQQLSPSRDTQSPNTDTQHIASPPGTLRERSPLSLQSPNCDSATSIDPPLSPQNQISLLQARIDLLKEERRELLRQKKAQQIQLKKNDDKMRKMSEKLKSMEALQQAFCNVPRSCTDYVKSAQIVAHIKMVILRSVQNHATDSHRTELFFKLLVEMMLYDDIHGLQLRDKMMDTYRLHMRRYVYSPFRILKEMDLAGGVLNYEGLEILRRCENNGERHKRTLIPSSGSVKKIAAMMERFGAEKIPFRMIRNSKDGTEGFYFRVADMVREVILARKAVAEGMLRNLMMAQTLDGATLTNYTNHTLAGIKFNDKSNPLTSSRNDVTPLVCVMGSETKANVRGIFSVLFAEIAEAANTILPRLLGILALWIVTNCDMSCEWKLCGCGGGCQECQLPVHEMPHS